MGEIIDLEDYRSRLELEELDRLREELDTKMEKLTPIYPEPYFGEDYFSSVPRAGSLGLLDGCPSCGYNVTTWTATYTEDAEDES
jgi:hypothetical protein